jgi:sulfatase maturation enzyme AslB (radical SAM superfamily)
LNQIVTYWGDRMEQTFEDYINHMINEGFIKEDGTPLKCFHCENKEFEEYQEFYEEYIRVEFSIRCKKCQKHVSTWAYGNWDF